MTGNDSASPVQLAALTEAAAETLYQLVSTVPLPREDAAIPQSLAAAVVVRKLESALDYIARTISSPAVTNALPHAARHLDVAAADIGAAAHVIRSAQPDIEAGRANGQPARPSRDFPDPAVARTQDRPAQPRRAPRQAGPAPGRRAP
jgi:hypothetical protein